MRVPVFSVSISVAVCLPCLPACLPCLPACLFVTLSVSVSLSLSLCFKGMFTLSIQQSRTCHSRSTKPRAKNTLLQIGKCCFTSTETIRTIRDVEPRTATSTFTQLLSSAIVGGNTTLCTATTESDNRKSPSSSSMLLYVHRDHKNYKLGTVSPGRPPRLSHNF